jgi:tetratricopeptide (TPR) repeat protein
LAYEALNNHTTAAAAFTAATTANPTNALAWNNLGVVTEKLGNRKDAIGYYQRALKANPQLAEAKANLARFNATATTESTPR